MPSGSHSGGGFGGHSGGFSGGGHSSWGGHSGSGGSSAPLFPRATRGGRSVVIIGGFGGHRGRYVQSGLFSLLQFMLVIGFMMLFFGGIVAAAASPGTVKSNYQKDYDYYQSIIEIAESDPDKMLTTGAVITDRFMGKSGNKYYLTYVFYTASDQAVEGYTFTTYTAEDMKRPEYQIGETIVLALNCKVSQITVNTDSVDLHYKNTTLWDDDDFVTDYNSAKRGQTIGIVLVVVGVLLMAGAVVLFIVKSKKDDGSETTTVSTKENKVYCKYCGAMLKSGAVKCDNCGASLTESKMEETSSTTIKTKK